MTDLVLVTHSGFGTAIRQVAESIFGQPTRATVFDLAPDEDREQSLARLTEHLRRACSGAPVLILTDLPGATPHNLACAAAEAACPAAPVVTGLNLPMLLRALNHSHRPAAELAELAVAGGLRSTFIGGLHGGG